EKDLSRESARARRAEALESLRGLRVGDVVEVPTGRRAGYVVVLDPGRDAGLDGPRPTVLTAERQVRVLTPADVSQGVRPVASVRVPRNFSARNAKHKRDLASSMRSALARPHTTPRPAAPRPRTDDASLADLRRRLRSHPCHGCSEREDHARWAERHHRLKREHDALVRRIEGRTSSIARVLDRVCDVLLETGHLEVVPAESGRGTRVRVTEPGTTLRRLYAESDLLVAECLRHGAWDGLDAPSLAAVVSTVVYEARREDREHTPPVPGGPHGRLSAAIDRTVRIWSRLEDLEQSRRLDTLRAVDTGLVEPIHRWASG